MRLFEVYIEDTMLESLVNKIKEQYNNGYKEFILMCWCYPNSCHGEVIRKRVFELLGATQTNYVLHSGGAYGADTLFGEEASKYGIKVKSKDIALFQRD